MEKNFRDWLEENDDYLFEMANLTKADSGLDYDIWIDSVGNLRKGSHNEPRLKVDVDNDRIPVLIDEKEPKILVNKKIKGFNKIKKWIIQNYDILIKHWNKELTDRQALNALSKD